MNKTYFLRVLRQELTPLTLEEQEQIIEEYLSIFEIKEEEGKSETEIILELGDPVIIARQFLDELSQNNTNYNQTGYYDKYDENQYTNKQTGFAIGIIIFDVLLGIWLYFSAWLVVMSIYLCALASLISVIFAIGFLFTSFLGMIASIAIFIGLSMLFFAFANICSKVLIKLGKSHINWLRNQF